MKLSNNKITLYNKKTKELFNINLAPTPANITWCAFFYKDLIALNYLTENKINKLLNN
jgi:hypothetical protein